MHISRMRIRNFRNFRNSEFLFCKGVNTVLGENGSGKTNAFYAMRLLLDDALSRRANRLRESDFNRANGPWRGHWIIISLDFEELDASEGCQVIRHSVGHMDTENCGTYTFLFRPLREVRTRLFEMCRDGAADDDIQAELNNIDIDQYEPCFTGRSTADFTDEDVYNCLVGDFETLTFPNPDEEDASVIGVRMTQLIHNEVSCTFVKALRDVVTDLKSYRDSPLLSLLRGTGRDIKLADAEKIVSTINTLNADISSLEEIREISRGIQDTLHDTVGHTYSPGIDIESALPDDIDRLLQGLALKVSDPGDTEYQGDLFELSLGGANLIYLSLKLLEYETKISSDRVAHFLLIEEPEAHIHTHIQKTLFDKYGYKQTQVIVSTHSTHISAASRIRSVNILGKAAREAHVFHPSRGLEPELCSRIERYLDAVRSTLLFAKGVVLVEGDAELILIPELIKKTLGISLDELGISLISMSATVFSNVAIMFHEDRLRRRCAILTDLDTSIVELPASKDEDTPHQKKCRGSQEAGAARKTALDAMYEDNSWVDAFYAQHTFEVDLLLANNSDIVEPLLQTIYTRERNRTLAKNKLASIDVAVSGKEMLRLATKVGKGWFALLLSEHVDIDTSVPSYVLGAIAFACRDTVDSRSLRLMAKYRLNDYQDVGEDVARLLALAEKKSPEELISAFKAELPNDTLTEFLEQLGF